MIGVLAAAADLPVAGEFFELFKTPWEPCVPGRRYDAVIDTTGEASDGVAAVILIFSSQPHPFDERLRFGRGSIQRRGSVRVGELEIPVYGDMLTLAGARTARSATGTVVRFGYDLFGEVRSLLTAGQPIEMAHIPTLDRHIEIVRSTMVALGVPLVEIPSTPPGRPFIVCLTHDIDFIGIRQHLFDHSMAGFLYRSVIGAVRDRLRGRITTARLLRIWRAVLMLPFVVVGWAKDFWEPFAWYLHVEAGLGATYFLIPFKRRAGRKLSVPRAARRATAYDVDDISAGTVATLLEQKCELGVHGIDAWHSEDDGAEERKRVERPAGRQRLGIRMHWLMNDDRTPVTLERAGYAYDSTAGYNETVGYRNGTGQVFRPLATRTLLELPMHIQDGALFYPQRLDLSEADAASRCDAIIQHAAAAGGVVTVLWHDRSHGPERFWGDFYVELVDRLKSHAPWFATGLDATDWFRMRRSVAFAQTDGESGAIAVRCERQRELPPLTVRIHRPGAPVPVDAVWDGATPLSLDRVMLGKPADPTCSMVLGPS